MNSPSKNPSKIDLDQLRQTFQAQIREILYGPPSMTISVPEEESETWEIPPEEQEINRASSDTPPVQGILTRFVIFLYRNAKRCTITGFWLIAVLLFLAEYSSKNALLVFAFLLYGLISIPLFYWQIRHALFFPSREQTNPFFLFVFYSFLIAAGLNALDLFFPQSGLGNWIFLALAPGCILCGILLAYFRP